MNPVLEVTDPYYIVAADEAPDATAHALKHGETFAVLDSLGDMGVNGTQQGLFHEGTRHLSRCQLRISGHRPFLLGTSLARESHVLTVDLANPDLLERDGIACPRGTVHLRRTIYLCDGVCFTHLSLSNHGQEPVALSLEWLLDADFRDVFEIRGTERQARGVSRGIRPITGGFIFEYEGLDQVVRQTVVQVQPPPDVSGRRTVLNLTVEPSTARDVTLCISCTGRQLPPPLDDRFSEGLRRVASELVSERSRLLRVRTSSDLFDEWLARSAADVALMITATPHGRYPYAGVPWFSTMFGRDGIITALSTLWADPTLSRDVLWCLAARQATGTNPARDAQPGKILHETRQGEMAALGEIPFDAYYGSVDATPLFVMLAGRYLHRTGDRAFIEHLWPHIQSALAWIETDGDLDGDGFVEYARATGAGLRNQGWKDSHDAISHADGTLAEGAIALCEVQAYAYEARRSGASIAEALGERNIARHLRREAEALRMRFEQTFWCDDLSTYALALDGARRACRVTSSNAGHVLISGIASPARARRVAATLMSADMFSGWGMRTLSRREVRYNPMSYHNGSVWPHDTAMVALGLANYGYKNEVVSLVDGLFQAAQRFDLRRLPELFCGFARRIDESPTRYPTACSPQAWAAAAPLLLVQALLGLDIDGRRRTVTLRQPRLPTSVDWLRLDGLRVADAELDLLCERRADDVSVSVVRRSGNIKLVTEK
jgi:glycogen debranching enzyme